MAQVKNNEGTVDFKLKGTGIEGKVKDCISMAVTNAEVTAANSATGLSDFGHTKSLGEFDITGLGAKTKHKIQINASWKDPGGGWHVISGSDTV